MEDMIINIKEQPLRKQQAAEWFSKKWGIPGEEYLQSIEQSLDGQGAVPQWYLALEGERIIGGIGVIENDFHPRKDLAPNVCALYVEEDRRLQGLAGRLLARVCKDMAEAGIPTLYLITEHTSFYERYGWKFFCMVREDGDGELMRMYVRTTELGHNVNSLARQQLE